MAATPTPTPTALAILLGMLAIVILPASLTYTFGRMTHRQREGWLIFGVMVFLFVVGIATAGFAEQRGNGAVAGAGRIETAATANQPGGNMEGKETRFGIGGSVLTAIATSNGATGSFNSMHDSYTPTGNAVTLVNMLLGELVFGGPGPGIYSMVMMILLTLFFAGLMVGHRNTWVRRSGPMRPSASFSTV